MDDPLHEPSDRTDGGGEQVPFGQRFYDSPFVLLTLGLLVMVVFFTLWGLFEVMSLPQSTLP